MDERNSRARHTFKILQFSDIHYYVGCPQVLPPECVTRVREENPDLIVLTGDIGIGDENLKAAGEVFALFDQLGIPFTSVFGNHDCEWGDTKDKYFEVLQQFPHAVKTPMNPEGYDFENSVGNHIYHATENWDLYLLDDSWGVPQGLVSWYRDHPPVHHGFCFMHIPFKEIGSIHPTVCPTTEGVGCEPPEYGAVCPLDDDHGLFDAFCRTNMRAAYFGHDHLNDYQAEVDGVVLGYTRTADSYCYNVENSGYLDPCRNKLLQHPLPTGFKVFTLEPDGFSGYSRLFTGEKVQPFAFSCAPSGRT